MKVIINNLAWLKLADIDQVTLHLFRNELTIIPKEFKTFNQNRKPIYLYALTDKWLGMPRPYYFARKHMLKNPEEEYRIATGTPLSNFETNITLRPDDQEPMVKFCVDYFKKHEYAGGAVEAFTSFGKTISSFEIIKRVGLNTLVILHRENLLDQWIKSLKKFWPNVTTGRVQGNECDYLGKDITFAMVQTLMTENTEKFPKGFFEHFGLIVVDECHVFGAEKFGTVLPKFSNRYTLQLSGTIRRGDGCENVFKFCGGNTIYKVSEKNRIKPKVYVIDTKYMPNKGCGDKIKALAVITDSKVRNERIAIDIIKALKAGRNPLVMSERLEQLNNIRMMVNILAKREGLNITQGMYIGGKSDKQLEEALACDVVYATMQLAKEGVDSPCFPGYEEIFCNGKYQRIDTVKGNDVVFSHLGKQQKILGVSKKPFIGNLIKFKILNNNIDFTVTEDHIFPIIRTNQCPQKNSRTKICKETCQVNNVNKKMYCSHHFYRDYKVEWIKAKDIKKYDCFLFPFDFHRGKKDKVIYCVSKNINLSSFVEKDGYLRSKFSNNKGLMSKIPNNLCIDKEFCRLLGYYLSEGCVVNDKLYFSFHIKEDEYYNDVMFLMDIYFGLQPNIKKIKNAITLTYCNVIVPRIFANIIGNNGSDNSIPLFLYQLNRESVHEFIKGYWRGDGSDKRGLFSFTSVNKNLILSFRLLLLSIGISSSVRKSIRKNKYTEYNIFVQGTYAMLLQEILGYKIEHYSKREKFNKSLLLDDFIGFPAIEIEKIEYDGFVYNLGVSNDETYITTHCATHNCLDTLFLASPQSDVEQASGRVVRYKEGKKQPFVIDYVDLNIGCFKNSFISRYKLYRKLGFEVNGINGNQFSFLDYIKS